MQWQARMKAVIFQVFACHEQWLASGLGPIDRVGSSFRRLRASVDLECKAWNPDTDDQVVFHEFLGGRAVTSIRTVCPLALNAIARCLHADAGQRVHRLPRAKLGGIHVAECLLEGSMVFERCLCV